MPRRPPRLLVIASAILLAAVVGLWVRSYWQAGALVWFDGPYIQAVWSASGSLVYHGYPADDAVESRTLAWESAPAREIAPWFAEFRRRGLAGFWYERAPFSANRVVLLPLWFPAVPSSLPLAWAIAARRRRRPPGHCRSCGYDLTANASGRCPECGAAVAGPPVAVGPAR